MACSRVKITVTYYSPLSHTHQPTLTQTNPPRLTHTHTHTVFKFPLPRTSILSIGSPTELTMWACFEKPATHIPADLKDGISPMLLITFLR
jgi:hypothetical protein